MTQLPPFLMTSEEGSFAHETIKNRKPLIIDRILSHFDYTPAIRKALEEFKTELAQDRIQPLTEQTPDRSFWDQDLQPWEGKTWFEIPWFLAETFFYRRVLEIVHYFQPGPWQGKDPYALLKHQEIIKALPVFMEVYQSRECSPTLDQFRTACFRALWGNRGDLSNLHVFETGMGSQPEKLVIDHTAAAFRFIQQGGISIAYFLDNAGKELLFDLAFMDYLLSSNLAAKITCFVKNQPFFVSDVMPADLDNTLRTLHTSENRALQALAARFEKHVGRDEIRLEAPPFLTTARMFRQLPEVLRNQMGDHDLVILKGDVNYRRLVGDRHWPPTTPFQEAAGYFPTNCLNLRTLKAEIILGLTPQRLQEIKAEGDPQWLINGKRGMVTFLEK